MKLDESILEYLELNPVLQYEPVNVMQISDMLDFMKESAERLVKKSYQYFSTDDVNLQVDCIDIVSARLNDFVQVFMDIILFIRREEGTDNGRSKSLRYCITGYDALRILQTEDEKGFLNELLLRNEITHDYFNREMHQQKLIAMMQNNMDGALDVYEHLFDYCEGHGWMKRFVDKNSGKR